MKKRWIVIGIIFVLIVFTIFLKYVYFSSTEIKLVNTNGNPIQDGKVYISYSCTELEFDVGGGEHRKGFGYRESLTNNEGIVKFNSLNKLFVFNFPFMYDCKKYVTVHKEGYCPSEGISLQTCLREINNLPSYIAPEIESFNYDSSYTQDSKFISWNDKAVTMNLMETEFPEWDTSCNIFKDTCLKYEEFNTLLVNKDQSICTKKFISNEEKQNLILSCNQGAFNELGITEISQCLDKYKSLEEYQFIWKELNSECYTEIAFAKRDPSICNNVVDSEMQRRCFEFLALELKDISLCKNIGNELVYENCKFDVIKKIGDASKCSLIDNKEIRQLCVVYFS